VTTKQPNRGLGLQTSEDYFNELGGRACFERVHKILYDKLLSHPWLKGFFVGKTRAHLEGQQTDFMSGLLGGPRIYGGRSPRDGHCHLFVTKEIFQIRHRLLEESLIEANVPEHLREPWLKLDTGFEAALVKQSPDECKGRYRTEPVIVVPKPSFPLSRE
jgi:truncated hemoglobin YjbI